MDHSHFTGEEAEEIKLKVEFIKFPKYSDHRPGLFELNHVLTQHLGAAQRLPEITLPEIT